MNMAERYDPTDEDAFIPTTAREDKGPLIQGIQMLHLKAAAAAEDPDSFAYPLIQRVLTENPVDPAWEEEQLLFSLFDQES